MQLLNTSSILLIDNQAHTSVIYGLITVAIVLAIAFIVVFARALTLRARVEYFKKLREEDLSETNDILIEKSENELKLFFQFENILEELVKMMRKNDVQVTKIIEEQAQQRIILEYNLKSKHNDT